MKKILGLTIATIILITVTSLGSWAYFNDEETSDSNNIAAGTLDLKLNAADANVNIIAALTNKAPGDFGTPSATLANTGTLPGKLWMQFSGVTDTAGASGEFASAGTLSSNTRISPWIDTNNNSAFDAGTDYALKSDGTVVMTALQEDYVNAFCNGTTGRTWDPVIASMPAEMATAYTFRLFWNIPVTVGNTIQGDSFTYGITFKLDQIH